MPVSRKMKPYAMLTHAAAAVVVVASLAFPGAALAARHERSGAEGSVVVTGTVVHTKSVWDRSHRLIYTYSRVRVEVSEKAGMARYVTVKQVGGTIGRLRLGVAGQPTLVRGQRVRLTLSPIGPRLFRPAAATGSAVRVISRAVQTNCGVGYLWNGERWNRADMPVKYWIDRDFTTDQNAAIRAAFGAWQNDADSFIIFRYMGTTTRIGCLRDGCNYVDKGRGGLGLATTYYWADPTTKRMREFDVTFDFETYEWSTTGDPEKFDLRNTATHEAGHSLVLGDIYDWTPGYTPLHKGLTMYGLTWKGNLQQRTLDWGDRAGSGVLYADPYAPPNVGSVRATSGDRVVTVTWRNPTASDFAGVKIVRKVGVYPSGKSDGTQVFAGRATGWRDTSCSNVTTYGYRICAYDTGGHYAAGVPTSGTPRWPSVLSARVTETTITYGGSTRFSSTLTPAHPAAYAVNLLRNTGTGWSKMGPMLYSWVAGAFVVTASPSRLTSYRSSWAGDADHLPDYSRVIAVAVRSKLALGLSALSIGLGSSMRVNGYVSPRHDGKTVTFCFDRHESGVWKNYAVRYAKLVYSSATRSKAPSSYGPPYRGSWRVRLRFGDSDHTAASITSATFSVR